MDYFRSDMEGDRIMEKNYDFMKDLKSFKEYTKVERLEAEKHLKKVLGTSRRDRKEGHRSICVLLGYLWETEEDYRRKDILLEATWMAVRMSDKLEKAHGLIDDEKIL